MVNYVFLAIFTIEMTMKIIAQRLEYFKDPWNLFDFLIVTITLVLAFLAVVFSVDENYANISGFLRIVRILRLIRLLRRSE